MDKILRLRKGLGQYSAGTMFRVLNTDEKIGTVKLEALYNTSSSAEVDFENLDWLFDVPRQRTFYVPAINGKERRRKVRNAMRALKP